MSFLKHIKCNKYQKILLPYLEDKLSKEDRLTLENHLQGCTHCQTELKSISNISGTLKASVREPFVAKDDIWRNIRSEITKDTQKSQNLYLKPASVALALIIVIGIFTGLRLENMKEKPEVVNHITALKPVPQVSDLKQNVVKEKVHRPLAYIAKVKMDKSSKYKTNIVARINKPVMMAKLPEDIKVESPHLESSKSSSIKDSLIVKENSPMTYKNKSDVLYFNDVQPDQRLQRVGDLSEFKKTTEQAFAGGKANSDKLYVQKLDTFQSPVSQNLFRDQPDNRQKNAISLPGIGGSTGIKGACVGAASPKRAALKIAGQVTDIQTLINRLDKELADKDNSAALKTIDSIIALDPKDQSVWLKIASSYEALNEKEKAADAYKLAMNGSDESITKEAKEKLSTIK